ncbi:hypothetical protein BU25DRAFT_414685 [Macroventuria anomochaeta]|uniref:Uncharacterized protein n=1 Tax=Macroventuria anomochaeta TaxID=301207 RepID=A0ACB6RN76_9PLEO|nr:uncharacterized protein BU25DRAFT_414685 [Macroventuria anomochaeta]KAF2623177.1 hypothetical protein BU25DRAFT_414685 [Macroventuria anomochaeta]
MQLPLELLLMACSAIAAPLTPRSATLLHLQGLTALSRDLSTTDIRFPEKYFHESINHPHYDGRFADSVLPRKTRLFHMRLLLRSYMATMERAGVRTWVMHGSLLGWWWNQGIFPWDSDLDFCVEETGIAELGAWWNMTVHSFSAADLGLEDPSKADTYVWDRRRRSKNRGQEEEVEVMREPEGLKSGVWETVMEEGKKYLLEVNPHYTDISTSDTHNVIDARWIDTHTGLFIDITTVHPVPSSASAKSQEKHQIFLGQDEGREERGSERAREMFTKDTHLYTTSSLFPLRESTLEGTRVFVPYAYEQLLLEEYGPQALTDTWFNSHMFEKERKEWTVALDAAGSNDKGRGDREDAAGRFKKGGKKPKWKSPKGEDGVKVEDNVDKTGEKAYTPVPGSG